MKVKEMLSEQHILSSADQDERINKMWRAKGDEGYKLLYMWVKQDVISFKEFKELMVEFTKH